MRGRKYSRKYSIVLLTSLIFVFSLATMSTPVKAEPLVKIYVDQPLGYIPFVTPGSRVIIDIKISTSGIADGTAAGIVAWGIDVRIDPNVLNINLTAPPPPPFPPPPPPASVIGAKAGYFLFTYASWYGLTTSLLAGTSYPSTGYWDDISETLMPTPAHGAGDYASAAAPKLVTLNVTSKSDTMPCLIDIIDAEYKTADKQIHPVDVVVDGYYGQPPPYYMSYVGGILPPGDPTSTDWHELYPNYCKTWHLASWEDTQTPDQPGYGEFSPSDQIDMTNETGWKYWFHVDAITTTIHWTFKPPSPEEPGEAEPVEPHLIDEVMRGPVGSWWHQIYPVYSKWFMITSWEDTNGNGQFDPSDQFDFQYEGDPEIYWARLDSVTTDIILTQKPIEPEPPPVSEFPLGLGLMIAIALAIPIVYLWRTRKKED